MFIIRNLIRKELLREGSHTHIVQTRKLVNAARRGDRVVINDKTIWPGQGNRAGLHSYADELIHNKWEKGKTRFMTKLAALVGGERVEIHSFRSITRDRGKWEKIAEWILADKDATSSLGQRIKPAEIRTLYSIVLDFNPFYFIPSVSDISTRNVTDGTITHLFGDRPVWIIDFDDLDDGVFVAIPKDFDTDFIGVRWAESRTFTKYGQDDE
jgi:hypothetical protein